MFAKLSSERCLEIMFTSAKSAFCETDFMMRKLIQMKNNSCVHIVRIAYQEWKWFQSESLGNEFGVNLWGCKESFKLLEVAVV